MTKYVGQSINRLDSYEKVIGLAKYTFDIENSPSLLHAKFITSPYAHAKIINIDYTKAEKMPGVKAVITGKDFPVKIGLYAGDRDILAVDRVTWVGQPVVAVAATNERIAEEALKLISIDYEELPAVLDPEKAKEDNNILVHPEMHTYEHSPAFNPIPGTNVANHFKLRKGNIEEGFARADMIIEGTYRMPQVSHSYMETISTMAHYKVDGTIDIISSAQSPFTVQYLLAVTFAVPLHKIKVIAPYLGGGFGGKAGLNFEPLVVLLSKKAGYKPVKIRLTREENFYSAAIRVGLIGKIKTGITKSGRIVAEEIEYILDSGACADYAVNVGRAAGYAATGPYDIDNIKGDTYTVYTNKPYATAFRGFGHMELHFAIERQRDVIAKKLGMNPLEFRVLNTVKPGKSITANSIRLREDAGNVDECLTAVWNELVEKSKDWKQTKPWILHGIGISCFMKGPAQPPNSTAAAIIKFRENGSITLSVGTSEMGQGTVTGLAQLAAEILKLPIEKIKVSHIRDTDADAYTWQTVGSRSLFMDGNAVINAAIDAKEQIIALAAQILRVPEKDLELGEERVQIKGKPWEGLDLKDIVMGYMYPDGKTVGGPIIGRGYYTAKMTNLDSETGAGNPAIFKTFGSQGVELEVDILTGEITILRLVSAFDIGKVINPQLYQGQIIGGSVMAISLAMKEKLVYDNNGNLLNPNFIDYAVVRAMDIPKEFTTITVENPQADGPFGARGIGELTMLGVPAAIANALSSAIGVEFNELPLTPENVVMTIKKKKPDFLEEMLDKLIEEVN